MIHKLKNNYDNQIITDRALQTIKVKTLFYEFVGLSAIFWLGL